ncbi:hypothetical protein [Chryseobacterium sp. FH1]|uniref:hypothetical protein n=1 Tax=Chryseobacterium sp. FH1 TaxID=1233951 RepID=UPI0004E409C2|nr:hypothetical protein [Chryseobacterium sp. FH1]KFC19672.1 hypothetical protein IO90_10390 [Chryseobacterium sp. FH1]
MATEIKYTNRYDKILTPQQLNQTEDFVKQTYVDGMLKMKEDNYRTNKNNKKFKRVTYFLDDVAEDKNTIAEQFCNVEENASCTIRYNKQTANGFTLWDVQFYDIDGQPAGAGGQEVYDSQGRIVYSSSFYEQTGQLRSVTKVMYANQVENAWEDALFDFHFSFDFDTGGINFTISDTNHRYHWLMPQNIDVEFVQGEGYWDSHPYYHSHLPVLPQTPII